ncbi:MAG: YceI family protein [Arcobacter sp.]|jgi:polyisoprenoid-binding protein YceI|uniref:YceI-like domain-containing periplasmic protein n=1 Tax=Arcobacter defluvii TaxID=873191 RepID=A0AAE7E5T0_9BACT|nr:MULTISPECIES: YceI family protein [Arcobacter]MDY3201171.1 YceI family protein [Arcobacter sp.]QKF76221.1 YceI-like domain-containing periplasmic protein [Arcobacter defluvii]RXI30903.1 polyisoprenoid-binding protein [Arcobacter defluvii]BAK72033.1 periplasmic protein [Arcobacter sp. L]
MNFVTKMTSALLLTIGLVNASEYDLDKAHTNVGFTVKHMMITNVNGNFKTYDANIDFDAKSKTFKAFKATVDTTSIDTGIEKRDNHLRSEDFFSSEKFPKMTFEMTSYKADGDEGEMKGNLTIRGISKPVTFKVEDLGTISDKGKSKVGFSIEGKINRMDYDLKWNKALELGGVAVAEDVKIKVDVEAVEK